MRGAAVYLLFVTQENLSKALRGSKPSRDYAKDPAGGGGGGRGK